MNNITIEHLLDLVAQIPEGSTFDYAKPGPNKARLVSVDKEGQKIQLARVPDEGEPIFGAISSDSLQTMVSRIIEETPVSIDEALLNGGNLRSVLEAILLNTSEFYSCKVGRNKKIVWVPSKPHNVCESMAIDIAELSPSGMETNDIVSSDDMRKEFEYFLSHCVKSSNGHEYLSDTTVRNYSNGLNSKVFEYAKKYQPDLNSIFDIQSPKEAKRILLDGVLNDTDFVEKDSTIWRNMYANALFQYICFLNARRFFGGLKSSTTIEVELGDTPLQQIFYGAPGTGKSHTVKETTDALPKENVFRTTFHPDSDYSTFVGAYKPTTHKVSAQPILDYDGMVDKFKKYISDLGNITHASAAMGYNYHDSIVRMQENGTHTIQDLLTDAHKSGTTYDTTIRSGMLLYEEQLSKGKSATQITYEYVPQAFLKAYVRAYQTSEPVFLVIEEINRGNCAQVFGDMFQLLDRNEDGVSDYAVKPDTDIENYLVEQLGVLYDPSEGMRLPSNLYIWATMNTSDQSLFPIDSAFKRRWDWVYVPIEKGKDKDTDTEMEWKIVMDDGTETDWWEFLQKINAVISNLTSSADKQLGFFFCKAKEGKIDQKTFVNKVLFYLWNDVFKDYAEDGNPIFKFKHDTPEGKSEEINLTFPDFFKYNDAPQAFVNNVLNWDKDNK